MSNELGSEKSPRSRDSASHSPLKGVRILIARPQEQGSSLAAQLQELGAEVIQLPTIEIQPTPHSPELKEHFLNLDKYSHVIAISAHAANYALEWIDQYWPQLPIDIKWFCVGKRTAAILNNADIQTVTPPQGNDSESLLDLPELAELNNENILILRGNGGRELLKQELEQRGANVNYAELYQRLLPEYSHSEIDDALIRFSPEILITLSGETLHNLIKMSQNNNISLTSTVVLVPSNRVAEQARLLGFKKIWVPEALDEHSLIECLTSNYKSLTK